MNEEKSTVQAIKQHILTHMSPGVMRGAAETTEKVANKVIVDISNLAC